MNRIRIIQKSTSAFICGLFGLLPVLGLPFGIAALVQFVQVRRQTTDWNPAERYLDWGAILALIGFLLTLFALVIAFLSALNQLDHSSGGLMVGSRDF